MAQQLCLVLPVSVAEKGLTVPLRNVEIIDVGPFSRHEKFMSDVLVVSADACSVAE